uniref:4a-hydroxytetrahydrobiopterin dehydratase n=1 Tax=Xenopus tropicalis TaxID=8364 RepID=A0A803K9Y0_XENTR
PEEKFFGLQSLSALYWKVSEEEGKLFKQLKMKTNNIGFIFIVKGALWAKKMGYHPQWGNLYGQLKITISGHDCPRLKKKNTKITQYIEKNATT